MQPKAILCLNCGFNLKTGVRLKTVREVETGSYRLSGGPVRTALVLVGAFFLCVGIVVITVVSSEENSLLAVVTGIAIAVVGSFVCTCALLSRRIVSIELALDGKPEIIKSYGLGPLQFSSRYPSAEYDTVWFVQTATKQDSGRTYLLLVMLFLICMGAIPGLIWWFLLLRGQDDVKVTYRVELPKQGQRPVVLLRGGEDAKYDADAVSKLIRDATDFQFEQDLGLV